MIRLSVGFGSILLKKSKVEPRRKTVDMTSTSSIDSKYYRKFIQSLLRLSGGKRWGPPRPAFFRCIYEAKSF
jgi:hypothetical protein